MVARRLLVRTVLVPVIVFVLALLAIAATTRLQSQARKADAAEKRLAKTETALNALATAPFRASRTTGGSASLARTLIDSDKAQIDTAIARLLRDSPPAALSHVSAPLLENYVTFERIFQIGVAGEYGREADGLAATAAQRTQRIIDLMNDAERTYAHRSATAGSRARIGSALMILLLVAAFAFLYRRATRARSTAERLVVENARLLAGSRIEALTDSLTGLPNRRSLVRDLETAAGVAAAGTDHVLALFDLDGFKQYNDSFGHPAGDALLTRLGSRLLAAVEGQATAYRMGGDEFCVLTSIAARDIPGLMAACAEALSEVGEAFTIGCSFGRAAIPDEAITPDAALQLADQRMYDEKVGRASSSRQSTDVLLTVLNERNPELLQHLTKVAGLAEEVAHRLRVPEPDIKWIRIAAELHDVGKMAIPDAILHKPGPLSDDEWVFMRRHTLIGERIIRSAPSLAPAAQLVRSSHERYDGAGYPDGLRSEEIDIGAGIIAVCDAYDAMVDDRIYSPAVSPEAALVELRRCAATQFDPAVVDAFAVTLRVSAAA